MLGRSPRPPRESSSRISVGIELVQHDHSSNLFPIIVVREHKQIGRTDSGAVVVGKWSKRKQKEMSISPHSSERDGGGGSPDPSSRRSAFSSAMR